jgi:hypothetical protein
MSRSFSFLILSGGIRGGELGELKSSRAGISLEFWDGKRMADEIAALVDASWESRRSCGGFVVSRASFDCRLPLEASWGSSGW